MHLLFRDNFISRFSISGFTWIRAALLGSGFHNTFLPHSILEMSKKPVCDSLPQPFLYILISSPFFTTAPFFWDIAILKRQHTRGKKNYQALKWVKKPKRLQGSTQWRYDVKKSAIMR